MTQPQPVPLEPLWSEERINRLITSLLFNTHTPRAMARRVAYTIRDEYEAKLDEYQAVFLYYIDQADKMEAALTTARVQQQAQPVPPVPIWDDARMAEWVDEHWMGVGSAEAMGAAMRDEYQAYVALQAARIAELEAQVHELERMVSLEFEQAVAKGKARQ